MTARNLVFDVFTVAADLMPVRDAVRAVLPEDKYAENTARMAALMDTIRGTRPESESRLDTVRYAAPLVANRIKAKVNAGEMADGEVRYHLFLAGALEWLERPPKESP